MIVYRNSAPTYGYDNDVVLTVCVFTTWRCVRDGDDGCVDSISDWVNRRHETLQLTFHQNAALSALLRLQAVLILSLT